MVGQSGALYYGPRGESGPKLAVGDPEKAVSIGINASKSSPEYGTQPTVTPASADMVVGIYLGRTAQI